MGESVKETEKPVLSRPGFCGRLLGMTVVSAVARKGSARAQPAEKADEEEAVAKSLGYRHDASQVDATAFPKRAMAQGAGQFCNNCALFEGEPGNRWAPCSVFQDRQVAGKGWCNAWVSRS